MSQRTLFNHHARAVIRRSCLCVFAIGTAACALLGNAGGQENEAPSDEPRLAQTRVLLVLGAEGDSTFADDFQAAAAGWREVASRNEFELMEIEPTESLTSREALKTAIEESAQCESLWIVMIGHGTFARNSAKFNLPGPDVSATELAEWLDPFERDLYLIQCFSASAPFLKALSGKRRIVVASTKSGAEYNYSRFGKYLASAVNELSNDLDHDESVSLLEAFLAANSQTQKFYEQESRLATEHALLNDNADSLGTPGEFYVGIRPTLEAEAGKEIDGSQASKVILFQSPTVPKLTPEQAQKRIQLEMQLELLRGRKTGMSQAEYLNQLEALMLELSAIYAAAEKPPAESETPPSSDAQSR